MKIDGKAIAPIVSIQATHRVSQSQKKAPLSDIDKVAVSDKAQAYQALLQKAKELPSIREERVRALSEKIERGEFKVDAQKIAEKLVSPE